MYSEGNKVAVGGENMKRKTVGLMSIATALASLGTVAQAGTPPVTSPEGNTATTNEQAGDKNSTKYYFHCGPGPLGASHNAECRRHYRCSTRFPLLPFVPRFTRFTRIQSLLSDG